MTDDEAILAFITVFNIFNSMNASAASRTKQYGIMRSIGMGADQLRRMIAAEAFTYAVPGCVAGCILGLPLNKLMFQFLIFDCGKVGNGMNNPRRLAFNHSFDMPGIGGNCNQAPNQADRQHGDCGRH